MPIRSLQGVVISFWRQLLNFEPLEASFIDSINIEGNLDLTPFRIPRVFILPSLSVMS